MDGPSRRAVEASVGTTVGMTWKGHGNGAPNAPPDASSRKSGREHGPRVPQVGDVRPLLEPRQQRRDHHRRVRPAVAQDGGDITFHGFEEGVVYLAMKGACSGCPSSTATLKAGIENMLRHYIPEVVEVRAIR